MENVNHLEISSNVKNYLNSKLKEFNSYRIGNDLTVKSEIIEEPKVSRKASSFLKKLFITEYAD